MPGIFPAISLMPLMAFSRSSFETLSLNLYTTTCSTVFGWPKRFCTATLRACSEPAAIPATNMAAPRAICEARFMADVISSSPIGTLPVYVSHAGRATRGDHGTRSLPKWFDGAAAGPLRSQVTFIEGGMDWSSGESQEQQSESKALPPLPRVWIGYLLGVATMIAEMIAVTLHPELAKEPLLIPPLYLFLAKFISLIYWLVCVYE